jgi:paired amphipathic helix protein Sin3a
MYVFNRCVLATHTDRIWQDPHEAKAYVRLFKKDDPTFDFTNFDRIKKWRCYVASFMAVEPTEDVDLSNVRPPFLRHTMTNDSDNERFEHVKMHDKITINIAPDGYMMKFDITPLDNSTGIMYLVQRDAIRSGISEDVPNPVEEYKQLKESRRELVQEKLFRNNAWMKDLSRDDVDARKDRFKKDLEEPEKGAQAEDGEDVEMEEL